MTLAQAPPTYILGVAQTDFARHAQRAGLGLFEMMGEATFAALSDAALDASAVQTIHVGNFVGELTSAQGQLGGLAAAVDPAFHGLPTARHEAACASGSIAINAAMTDLESGRYDIALVLGVEQLRHMGARPAAGALATAAWAGREATEAEFVWPSLFGVIADEVAARYGLEDAHLRAWSELMFANAKRHPLSQTRDWDTSGGVTVDDGLNPVVEGRLRKLDCGRLTDGAAAVVLASPRAASAWAKQRGIALDRVPRIAGWGHTTGTMLLADKLASSSGHLLFPHVAAAAAQARRRAGVASAHEVSAFELHDCFSITGYTLVDHVGLTPAGRAFEAFESGALEAGGVCPVNPGGGLIGLGHPVGATGVRMVVDAAKQVTGRAGDCQVPGATTVQTLNLGGSATTVLSFVVAAGPQGV